MYYHMPRWIEPIALTGLCAGAALKGGLQERLAVGAFTADLILSVVVRDTRWPHVQWAEFGLDIILLVLLLVIAMRTAKFWPLTAAAFWLLETLTHVASLADRKVNAWSYLTAIIIWTYAVMITLAVGVWNSWRAERYVAKAAHENDPAARP